MCARYCGLRGNTRGPAEARNKGTRDPIMNSKMVAA